MEIFINRILFIVFLLILYSKLLCFLALALLRLKSLEQFSKRKNKGKLSRSCCILFMFKYNLSSIPLFCSKKKASKKNCSWILKVLFFILDAFKQVEGVRGSDKKIKGERGGKWRRRFCQKMYNTIFFIFNLKFMFRRILS